MYVPYNTHTHTHRTPGKCDKSAVIKPIASDLNIPICYTEEIVRWNLIEMSRKKTTHHHRRRRRAEFSKYLQEKWQIMAWVSWNRWTKNWLTFTAAHCNDYTIIIGIISLNEQYRGWIIKINNNTVQVDDKAKPLFIVSIKWIAIFFLSETKTNRKKRKSRNFIWPADFNQASDDFLFVCSACVWL